MASPFPPPNPYHSRRRAYAPRLPQEHYYQVRGTSSLIIRELRGGQNIGPQRYGKGLHARGPNEGIYAKVHTPQDPGGDTARLPKVDGQYGGRTHSHYPPLSPIYGTSSFHFHAWQTIEA